MSDDRKRLNRRDFIKKTAAAGVAVAASTKLGSFIREAHADQMFKGEKLRVFTYAGAWGDQFTKNFAPLFKKVTGADIANGKALYESTCVSCHGTDGKTLVFDGAGIGAIANGNPVETLHKIRFGQPATGMPSAVASGWSTQDAVDVLGYSQTLPE